MSQIQGKIQFNLQKVMPWINKTKMNIIVKKGFVGCNIIKCRDNKYGKATNKITKMILKKNC